MKYTDSHEWISVQDGEGVVGISAYAQKELGEVVYVELPRVGAKVVKGEEMAVLESTKAAADIYAPVSGEIMAVNEKLKEDLAPLNHSPEKEGWICKIAPSNLSEETELLSLAQYESLVD